MLKEPFYVGQSQLMGHIAHWCVRLSPYPVPTALESVLSYFAAQTAHLFDAQDFRETTLADVRELLREHLLSQVPVQRWNRCRTGPTPDYQATSARDKPRDPDRDFVDLDALSTNIVLALAAEMLAYQQEDERYHAMAANMPEPAAVLTLPQLAADWQRVAGSMMLLILADHGIISAEDVDRHALPSVPTAHQTAIAAGLAGFFTAHPTFYSLGTLESLCHGLDLDPAMLALPEYGPVRAALDAYDRTLY